MTYDEDLAGRVRELVAEEPDLRCGCSGGWRF